MKTSHTLRALSLSAAAFAALFGNNEALAQSQSGKAATQSGMPTQAAAGLKKGLDAMNNRRPAQAGELPRHAKAESGVVGELDAGVLAAREVALTLADGAVITARLVRVASDAKHGSQSWIGTFDDSPASILVITKAKGVVTGFANYDDQVLEIQPTTGGNHVLFSVDSKSLPKSDGYIRQKSAAGDVTSSTGSGDVSGTMAAAGDAVVQDVLVVYTAASASAHGQASLEGMIQSAVQSANQAYLNSQVGVTMNLVGMQQVAITESGTSEATLSKLQSDSAVRSLRDQLAADLVILLSQDSNWCGYAYLMTSNSTSFAPSAYAVVYPGCLSNQSLAHEAGHLQGLDHDRTNAAGGGVDAYSYGYRRCVSDGTAFRDIMSYAASCSAAPRVLLFSNPYVNYNGYPAGIAYESDPANSAENARTLNNTAATVAAFRGVSSPNPTPSTPAAPTGLNASSVAYNKVSVAWTDNATNESGYKVERSLNGVDFVEIASLSADSRSHADSTVSARTNYSYRVRAFNSSGVSGYSNTVQVTTPDVPPPPPSAPASVSALDRADGTANVSWLAGTTTASSFEVRREKWDTRKLTWGSTTTAATVPSSVLSIIDSTGSGTYRYSVRGVNSGGASGFAGPAPVTVTGGKAKGRR